MRTTIDLDPDVDARLRALARERGVPLRTLINQALRAGMQPSRETQPYVMPSFKLGIRPGVDVDKALQAAAQDEDDDLARKLELRK